MIYKMEVYKPRHKQNIAVQLRERTWDQDTKKYTFGKSMNFTVYDTSLTKLHDFFLRKIAQEKDDLND